ncbi:MAG TPA: isocitrate lyase/PEP mutase family protein [Candidatus Acidoferrales bacterium]|jgi:carboxyvinyl-carboxyphosphonate phosphorylmutase|nr:isocitrate lyase/PEP mutase family protein [Candidatus Acidoferrales bacterium]
MNDFLKRKETQRQTLRELLAQSEPVLAPGAYDALSARIIEQAGFPAVYMTGFGTAASLLGRPDVGLLGMSEMIANAARIAQVVDVPVIADADTGYGNPLNVIRTVREYERAGVSAIHMEDQILPKKCGHMENKQVIAAEEMTEKIRAAVEARTSPDFLIIARTDARAPEGLYSALRRARTYREAGADMLFIEGPQSEEEVTEVARAFPQVPLLFNWAEGGKTPPMPFDRLKELGYRLIIFPISALLVVAKAVREVMAQIRKDGTPINAARDFMSFKEFNTLAGLTEIQEIEHKFSVRK